MRYVLEIINTAALVAIGVLLQGKLSGKELCVFLALFLTARICESVLDFIKEQ